MTTRLENREGRISAVQKNYAFIACHKVGGGIMMQVSSSKIPCTDLTTVFSFNDTVKFCADPFEGKNKVKFMARNRTVEVLKKAENNEIRGSGSVSHIDKESGHFGFIKTCDGNSVYFSANTIIPKCNQIDKLLKLGENVRFIAIPQPQITGNSSLRATRVWRDRDKEAQKLAESRMPINAETGQNGMQVHGYTNASGCSVPGTYSNPSNYSNPSRSMYSSNMSSPSADDGCNGNGSAAASEDGVISQENVGLPSNRRVRSEASLVQSDESGALDGFPNWIRQAPVQALSKVYSDERERVMQFTDQLLGVANCGMCNTH